MSESGDFRLHMPVVRRGHFDRKAAIMLGGQERRTMTLLRTGSILFTLAVGLAGQASAQMPPGFGFPAAPQQEPPCMKDFVPLREEAQKRASAIRAGMEKKVPRDEACKLFQNFAAAEIKMIKFAESNAMSCGIPPQAIEQMKAGHANTIKARTQVCAAGAGPAKPAV